jgi:hypothetical protein
VSTDIDLRSLGSEVRELILLLKNGQHCKRHGISQAVVERAINAEDEVLAAVAIALAVDHVTERE